MKKRLYPERIVEDMRSRLFKCGGLIMINFDHVISANEHEVIDIDRNDVPMTVVAVDLRYGNMDPYDYPSFKTVYIETTLTDFWKDFDQAFQD